MFSSFVHQDGCTNGLSNHWCLDLVGMLTCSYLAGTLFTMLSVLAVSVSHRILSDYGADLLDTNCFKTVVKTYLNMC